MPALDGARRLLPPKVEGAEQREVRAALHACGRRARDVEEEFGCTSASSFSHLAFRVGAARRACAHDLLRVRENAAEKVRENLTARRVVRSGVESRLGMHAMRIVRSAAPPVMDETGEREVGYDRYLPHTSRCTK